MAKFKGGFGINADEAINTDAGSANLGYQGPLPPSGPYRGKLKRMELVKTGPQSKNPGTPMLKMLVEIAEPSDSKNAKYNEYGLWNNQMITEQSTPYVNQILNALVKGDERKFTALKSWFWNAQLITEKPDGGHIHAIGKFKINSPDADIDVIVNTKRQAARGNYEERLEINRWLVPSDDSDLDDDELDDDDLDLDEDDLDEDDEDDEFSDDEPF